MEVGESAFEPAPHATFIAKEERHRFVFRFESPEGEGGTGGLIGFLQFPVGFPAEAFYFQVNRGGFHGPEPLLAPPGDCHFLDEISLDSIAGLEFIGIFPE